jgi:hypothetical protein
VRRLLQLLRLALRFGQVAAMLGQSGFGRGQGRRGDAGLVLQADAFGLQLLDLALALDDAVGARFRHVQHETVARDEMTGLAHPQAAAGQAGAARSQPPRSFAT